MEVKFTVNFLGGVGSACIQIFQAGAQVGGPLNFDESGSATRSLGPGFYSVSVTGNSPPDGTNITISKPTTPVTPDTIEEGPITKAYSLHL